ncbi:sclerostin domain-containing protein 1-like [Nematolebias whitei]|uniref:sclerostin domain-containing protein 1-like n=1 Tax=Nematolebias whitei TaxID=451745 RepID=UPI0018997C5E|nr:sclerostin domain-containing protein 1-like [Nematolebias whitei]
MLRTRELQLLALLMLMLLLRESSSAVQNDATESGSLQPDLQSQDQTGDEDSNQARHGARQPDEPVRNGPNQSQVECRELRSTKYISDGQCTSISPIKELVCAGECLPANLGSNWIGIGGLTKRFWSRRDAPDWRCVIDRSRTQRIQLQCHDGSSRIYKINVVTSCKCKRFTRQQNDSGHKDTSAQSGKLRKTQEKVQLPEGFDERLSDN